MAMATATLYHRMGTVNIVQVQSASDGQTVLDMATISSPYQGSTATAAGNHGICGSDDAPDLGVSYELAPGPWKGFPRVAIRRLYCGRNKL